MLDLQKLKLTTAAWNCLSNGGYLDEHEIPAANTSEVLALEKKLSTITRRKLVRIKNCGKVVMREIIDALTYLGVKIEDPEPNRNDSAVYASRFNAPEDQARIDVLRKQHAKLVALTKCPHCKGTGRVQP